ncbi:MAG TPA: alpha/beta hydrolase [Solirubrobacterales bacterium]|nr:alpha/beta hydrolase [Solirubrobacterales bacterium]
MPVFEYDGHTISYDEYGEGDRPLILIHGLLMSRRMFDRLGPEMAALGNRVIAVDLLGHGRSDRPPQMSNYSMTFFARQVEGLMDHLGIDQAVVGGTSLGANATLELNHMSPERVKAMMIEMPVLDNALLAAAVIFTPIMIGLRLGEPLLRRLASAARRIPRTNPLLDMGLDVWRQDPAPSSAVLEGLFLGSSAPHHQFRIEMEQPTLVIGHRADPLHPFSDSGMLAEELPNSRLIEANSILEWRISPDRLDAELAAFLDEVWDQPDPAATKTAARAPGDALSEA